MNSRTYKSLTRLFLLTVLMTVCGVSIAFAQLQMQNLTVSGFICPGQPLTITFQAQVDQSNLTPQVAGVLSTVSAASFSRTTDYLFLDSTDDNGAALAPGWAAGTHLDNSFALVPAGNLSMITYTWVTNPVPAFATGTVIYVNVSGNEGGAAYAESMNMTTDAHLSVAVTVNCNDKALNNTAVFGGADSIAPLVIIGGATSTFTNTPTNTFSPTITNTPPGLNTATVTNTATNTATMTSTNTATNTATQTFTNTPVNSFTFTNTFTITPTYTNTNTPVPSATPTNTFTPTPSGTFTNTPQSTFTFTNSATPTTTNTFTVTPSPTSFVGFGKTVSETQANAGDVLTYTIAVTVTGPSLTNPVITDVLPANMTFQAFGTMPAGTTTNQSPLQWTLPATLADGVYDITYQTKVNAFAQANVPLTNNAQLTYSGLLNPMKASVPVTVIGQFSVSVNIYNSAGEVIKTIPLQQFSTAINNIVLSTTNTITTLTGPGNSIQILYNGYVIGIWNGTNNANQPVSNGSYRVQVDNISTSGTVTSVSQTAIVNRSLSSVEVDIYNGAGEIVRKLYNVVDNSTDSNMTNVILSTQLLRPNPSNIPSSPTASQLQILVQDTISPVTLTWDGTDNSGTYVTPGQYEIQVHWTNGSGTTTDITRTIMVLPAPGVSGIVAAIPNVLGGKNGTTTTFNAGGVLNASSLKVKIYTLAGELVQSFVSGTTTATWNASGIASGIYIANVEIDNANGGVVNQQRLKILVIH